MCYSWLTHLRTTAPLTYGILDLLVLAALEHRGPLDGYNAARIIAEGTGGRCVVNYGTMHAKLLQLGEHGLVRFREARSANNRPTKECAITESGRSHLVRESARWLEGTRVVGAFLAGD
jgi:DNA-binding PadR family transcriptional regulator